ncbi:MAG TPA: DUF1963 domain-containing protein [Abditibacterium sp.]|jgi:uncharacterized protein YwqG
MTQIISFRPTTSPITEAITKFGGQPTWISEPQWPVSRETGNQMRFIAQVRLDAKIFGLEADKMAYLFMTDEDEDFVDSTFEYDGGENALVILPDGVNASALPLSTGPTLQAFVKVDGQVMLQPTQVEFLAELSDQDDLEDGQKFKNKIGGQPHWLQNEEWPSNDKWLLVLQLDSVSVPFDINFGDAGVGYAFLSADGKRGRFGWQCA